MANDLYVIGRRGLQFEAVENRTLRSIYTFSEKIAIGHLGAMLDTIGEKILIDGDDATISSISTFRAGCLHGIELGYTHGVAIALSN